MRRLKWYKFDGPPSLLCSAPPPQETVVQATGDTVTQPRYDLAIGNWAQILQTAGNVPTTQTGPPVNTMVLALALMPQTSGIFFVSTRLSWSCNTTALTITHRLWAKQGAGTGVIGGGAGAGKFGQYASSQVVSATGNNFTPSAQVLNVNAAGGGGLTFEGAAISAGAGVIQHQDDVGTLTGLLTANGTGTDAFAFTGIIDAGGPGTTKTAFNSRQPVVFAVSVTGSAAGSVAYDTVMLFAQELVTT